MKLKDMVKDIGKLITPIYGQYEIAKTDFKGEYKLESLITKAAVFSFFTVIHAAEIKKAYEIIRYLS